MRYFQQRYNFIKHNISNICNINVYFKRPSKFFPK